METFYDPIVHSAFTERMFDPLAHIVLSEPWWLGMVKRRTKNDRLFAVYHRATRKCSLCAWVFAPGERGSRAIFTELEAFTFSRSVWPEDLMPPFLLFHRLRPMDLEISYEKERRKKQEYARRQELEANEEAKRVASRQFRKMGDDRQADLVERGVIEVAPYDSEEYAQIRDLLR